MSPRTEFSRLLWKEFRQVRTLGIVLLSGGVILLFAFPVASTNAPAIIVANVVAILFGVAASATAFASEHENGTFLFQRALPIPNRFVASAKLCVACLGSLSIFLILWALSLSAIRFVQPATWGPNWGELNANFRDGLISLVEFLVFGTLLSLVERRPLVGLAKAVVVVLGIRWIGFVLDDITYGGFSNAPDFPWPSSSLRLASLAVGIALVVRFIGKWNAGEPIRFLPDSIGRTIRRELISLYRAEGVRRGEWRRLLWLQYRVSIWPIAAFTIIGISFATLFYQFDPDPIFYPPLATMLLGSIAYRAANRNRDAIAVLGTNPASLWLSQLTFPAVGCLFVVIAILCSESNFKEYLPAGQSKQSYLITLFVGLAAFTWGQLASLRSRGILTAVGLSFCYSLLALFWIMVAVGAEARVWLFVLPVIVYPLVESFFCARRWLSDGKQFRLWWLVRVGLYASLALGWMADRYYQIPAVSKMEFNQALSATPQLNELQASRLAEIVARLAIREEFNPSDVKDYDQVESAWKKNQRDWASHHRAVLDEVLSGSYLESLPGPRAVGDVKTQFNQWSVLHEFLLAGLELALDQEDVETAERIIRKIPMVVSPIDTLRWCKISTNDSARIRKLAQHFCDPKILDVHCRRRIFGLGFIARFGPDWAQQRWWPVEFNPNDNGFFNAFGEYLVEGINRKRLARYAAVYVARKLGEFQRIKSRPDPPNVSPIPWIRQVVNDKNDLSVIQIHDPADERVGSYVISTYTSVAAKLGGISLQLALVGWQMDHDGRLPDSLSELSPFYLQRIPLDVTGNTCFAFLKDRVVVATPPIQYLPPASFQYYVGGQVRTLKLEILRKSAAQTLIGVDGRFPPLIVVLWRVGALDPEVTPSEFAEKFLFEDGANLFPIDWPAEVELLPANND